MPQVSDHGLDVSKEEERYLRRTFRRFALPYVVALAVFAWAISALSGDASSPEAMDDVQQQLADAQASIEALEARVEGATREAKRAGKQVAELSSREDDAPAAEVDGLRAELRRASQRIAALEAGQKGGGSDRRIDAISDRVASIERRLESMASRGAAPAGAPRSEAPPASAPGGP